MPEENETNSVENGQKTAEDVKIQRLDVYRQSFPGERIPFDEAIGIVLEIANRLEERHRNNLPYLELRPANIARTEDGRIKLRVFEKEEEEEEEENSDKVKLGGKHVYLSYMSPEERAKETADQRSDVWSLAAVFFELVTGNLPFSGESADDEIRQIIDETSRTWEIYNEKQKAILCKALARSKDERYENAIEFATELEKTRKMKMPRWKAAAIGLGVLAAAALVVWFMFWHFTTPRELVVPTQYSTIQKAMDVAKPGDTIRVKAGVYETRVKLKDGVNLVGEAMDKVIIRSEARKGSVVRATDCKSAKISDLTLEHTIVMLEEERNPVLLIRNSSVDVSRCKIQKASGDGIFVTGTSEVEIAECLVESNEMHGISVVAGATANLKKNKCTNNGEVGIVYSREAHGIVAENTCNANEQCGIGVFDYGTDPLVKDNQCQLNKAQGIYLAKGTHATVEGNTCESNGKSGIAIVDELTAPKVLKNICRKNKTQGIIFFLGASGLAEENLAEENEWSGIEANGEGTAPTITNNEAVGNLRYGIAFVDGADGSAEGNKCQENKKSGIAVTGIGTEPAILNNQCIENLLDGISFSELAGGLAEGNECLKNHVNGISATGEGTKPVLRKNTCSENLSWGIFLDDVATPVIEPDNTAENNREGQVRRSE